MWLYKISLRRFKEGDRIRFFVQPRRGKGKGIVLTPVFRRGIVEGFDAELQTYLIRDELNNIHSVHPRNLTLDK